MGVSGAPGPDGRSPRALPTRHAGPRHVPRPARPRSGGTRPVGDRRSCRLPPLPHDRSPRALPTRHAGPRHVPAGPPEKWRRTTGRGPPQVSSPATSCRARVHRLLRVPTRSITASLPTRHAGPPRVPGRPAREVAANDRSRTAAGVVSRHFRTRPRALPPAAASRPRRTRPRSGGERQVEDPRSVSSPPRPVHRLLRVPAISARALPTRHAGPPRVPADPPEKWRRTTSRGPPQLSSPATSARSVSASVPTRHAGPPRVPADPPEKWRRTTSRGPRRCRLPPLRRAAGAARPPPRPAAREVAAHDRSRTAAAVVATPPRRHARARAASGRPARRRPAREVAARPVEDRRSCRLRRRRVTAADPPAAAGRPAPRWRRRPEDRRSVDPARGGRQAGRRGHTPGRPAGRAGTGPVTAPAQRRSQRRGPGAPGSPDSASARLGPPRAGRARRDDDAWRVRDGPARSRPRRGVRRVAPGRRHDPAAQHHQAAKGGPAVSPRPAGSRA